MRYSVQIFSNCSLYSIGRNEYFGFLLKLLDTFQLTIFVSVCISFIRTQLVHRISGKKKKKYKENKQNLINKKKNKSN